MSDTPAPDETRPTESVADRSKEFDTAVQIGRMVLKVARERTDNRYSMPYLDSQQFPQDAINAINTKPDGTVTEENVATAKQATVSLAIEAAAQIAEAQAPRGAGVREEISSLEGVLTLVKRGHGLLIQTEAQNPQFVLQGSREAIARRQKVQPDQVKLSDDELKKWAEENFQRSGHRLTKSVQAVNDYLRR